MHPDKKTLRNLFFVAGGCVVLSWILMDTARVHTMLNTIWNLISPFVMGAMLAFVFNVPMRAIENQLADIRKPGLRRALAILITIFLLVMILTFVVELLVPQLQKTIESLVETIPSFAKRTVDELMGFLSEHPELNQLVQENINKADIDLRNIDWTIFIQKVVKLIGDSVSSIIGSTFNAIGSVSSALISALVSVVFAIYCLGRKEILATQFRRMLYAILPERWGDRIVRVMRLTNVTFSNFISGQCLEACILGSLFAVSMLIFGMPYVPLVSVIIAVTALVPVVGAFVGCVLGAFFILVDNPVQAVSFVVLFLILQQLENNLIYPRVVGTSIGLPGMWVLVAVTIGGEIMGVAGMLVMIPMASVLYALMGEFTEKRLEQRSIDPAKLTAQPPDISSKFQRQRAESQKAKAIRRQEKVQKKQKQKK